jgi:hypothetical protein
MRYKGARATTYLMNLIRATAKFGAAVARTPNLLCSGDTSSLRKAPAAQQISIFLLSTNQKSKTTSILWATYSTWQREQVLNKTHSYYWSSLLFLCRVGYISTVRPCYKYYCSDPMLPPRRGMKADFYLFSLFGSPESRFARIAPCPCMSNAGTSTVGYVGPLATTLCWGNILPDSNKITRINNHEHYLLP